MDATAPASGQHPVELITERLGELLRVGIRPAHLVPYLDVLDLLEQDESGGGLGDPYQRAIRLADVLSEVAFSMGNGPMGRAVQALFGLTVETRGRLVKDRRRLAAEQLDVMPSTFRKHYERGILCDMALECWRLRSQTSRD